MFGTHICKKETEVVIVVLFPVTHPLPLTYFHVPRTKHKIHSHTPQHIILSHIHIHKIISTNFSIQNINNVYSLRT